MEEKITYPVLEIHAKRIRELVSNKKYRNPEEFLKTAIEILLTWESSNPQECMELMKTLMPFSPEQESFMKQSMNPDELKRQFGDLEIDLQHNEMSQQKKLALTDDDHLKIREGLEHVKRYAEALKITKPKDVIPYDGYPLLSGFYSRILPVKIVLSVLCHLLERNKDSKVELNELRVHAYDIAEEIAEIMSDYENKHDIPRNKKMSTGLPKKGRDKKDEEKIAMAQKRFKDQFVGKVRKGRITKQDHFEGALSALELVYAFEKDNKVYVSLTDLGKKFFLLDSPIMKGEYEKGPLSKQEADFILKHLIPKRKLEQKFIDAAISVIKQFQKTAQTKGVKITHTLDGEIKQAAIDYVKKNPKSQEKYNINLESGNESIERKITQWRLATMGRLAELKVVNWSINEKGDSEYSLS